MTGAVGAALPLVRLLPLYEGREVTRRVRPMRTGMNFEGRPVADWDADMRHS